nr:MAG TPA: hypothetical protein [Caudoviricetes sp.]
MDGRCFAGVSRGISGRADPAGKNCGRNGYNAFRGKNHVESRRCGG